MWVLEIELRSSERTTSTLNHLAISPELREEVWLLYLKDNKPSQMARSLRNRVRVDLSVFQYQILSFFF